MLVGTGHYILEGHEKTRNVSRENCDSRKGLKKNGRGHVKAVFRHLKDYSVGERPQILRKIKALGRWDGAYESGQLPSRDMFRQKQDDHSP